MWTRTLRAVYRIFFFSTNSLLNCNLVLPVSRGLHISLYYTQLRSEPSNTAADSEDGCLHGGKYEIKRKSLIN